MQFRDLGLQYAALKSEIDSGINAVIESHSFILGKQVSELEEQLAEFVGVKHCISCASGTDALILPLMAWDIKAGDAVFVPDFTFFATANCAMLRGATPVLVDIDPQTFNISCDALETAITKTIADEKLRPRVIIPVDLFGQPAEHRRIQEIADKYKLMILEDGAQGFGGSISGQRACSFGNAAATSFFPAKPLGCYGDGGAVFTNDALLNEQLRSLRVSGASIVSKYDNISIGLNSRLDTLQAAILLPKLKALRDYELDAVNDAARLYTALLKEFVVTPNIKNDYYSCWSQYTILLENEAVRDGLKEHLKNQNIPSMIYYPMGLHQQKALISTNTEDTQFPNTDRITKRCLALPMHPYLNKNDIKLITGEIIRYLHV